MYEAGLELSWYSDTQAKQLPNSAHQTLDYCTQNNFISVQMLSMPSNDAIYMYE